MNINIEAFLLCDAATEQQGKLNVLGAFDIIWTKKVPAIHPSCAIVVRIRFQKTGDHKVRIDVNDKDERQIIPGLDGNLSVNVKDDIGSAIVNFTLHLQRLRFENYGKYFVVLTIDNKIEG